MKSLFSSLLFLALSAASTFGQESGQPVHLRPTTDSPVLGHLAEDAFRMKPPQPVSLSESEKQEGWEAISFLDNLRGFVRRNDLTKDLNVAPGAAVFLSAEENPARLVTRAEANDNFEVAKLSGDWVEVSFRKPVTGFIRRQADRAPDERKTETAEVVDQADEEEVAEVADTRRRPISDRAAIPNDGILRSFQGQLSKPRSFFGRQPPYPYQMVDSSGNRIAYLDLSKLLITAPMEHVLGRDYEFFGRAEPIAGRRDFVIHVERMQRK